VVELLISNSSYGFGHDPGVLEALAGFIVGSHCHHFRDVGNIPRVVLPRDELHPKWAGFHPLLRIGSEPREVGCTWSTVNESGVLGGASYWIGPLAPRHSQQGSLLRLHTSLYAARSRCHGLPAAGIVHTPRSYPFLSYLSHGQFIIAESDVWSSLPQSSHS
jgi:hypothetical protein